MLHACLTEEDIFENIIAQNKEYCFITLYSRSLALPKSHDQTNGHANVSRRRLNKCLPYCRKFERELQENFKMIVKNWLLQIGHTVTKALCISCFLQKIFDYLHAILKDVKILLKELSPYR